MYYFIVNMTSRTGKTKKIWHEISKELKQRNVEFKAYTTNYGGHATELAKRISKMGDEVVRLVVVGGDGTVNEVINGIDNFEHVYFAYIPTGSGNDLGRGLGLKGSPVEILDSILDVEEITRMDVGCVSWEDGKEQRKFLISSGIGLDAVVCEQALTSKLKVALNRIGLGKLTYLLLTVRALFVMPEATLDITMDDGETKHIERMIFTVAMNHKCEGGGVPMAPNASATDGKLSLCYVYGFSRIRALFSLPLLMMKKQKWMKGFKIEDCKKADIRIDQPMVLHADGEYCKKQTKIQMTCMPQALKLMMKVHI